MTARVRLVRSGPNRLRGSDIGHGDQTRVLDIRPKGPNKTACFIPVSYLCSGRDPIGRDRISDDRWNVVDPTSSRRSVTRLSRHEVSGLLDPATRPTGCGVRMFGHRGRDDSRPRLYKGAKENGDFKTGSPLESDSSGWSVTGCGNVTSSLAPRCGPYTSGQRVRRERRYWRVGGGEVALPGRI